MAYEIIVFQAFNRQWNFCKELGLGLSDEDISFLEDRDEAHPTYESINLLHMVSVVA